ncbi:transposase [Catalinimonas sp. 4WD22]|uniref:transposase n=1 Tax=Catalinimonas locisalis TaxID=3133978 RepID=UPI003100B1CE
MRGLDLKMYKVLADGGFSSGFNYALLEADHLEGYVALYGKYKSQREGFTYNVDQDLYLCKQGKKLVNKGVKTYGGYFNYYYFSSESDCRNCPIVRACCGKSSRKKLTVSAFRNHFDRMGSRLTSSLGQRMKKLRMSTVEPVFGSLINYFGLKRINAKGKVAAHKCMLMSAAAYNLKKYVKFLRPRKVEVNQLAMREFLLMIIDLKQRKSGILLRGE